MLAGIEVERDGDVTDDCIAAHELHHITAEDVEVEQDILEFVLAEQVAQALDDLTGALDVLDDVGQDVAELAERGWRGLHEPTGSLGVGQDPGQWLVQLVGE